MAPSRRSRQREHPGAVEGAEQGAIAERLRPALLSGAWRRGEGELAGEWRTICGRRGANTVPARSRVGTRYVVERSKRQRIGTKGVLPSMHHFVCGQVRPTAKESANDRGRSHCRLRRATQRATLAADPAARISLRYLVSRLDVGP